MTVPGAILLKGMTIGPNGPVSDVRVSGDAIAEIGANLRPQPGEEVLHWPGGVILPGFVDSHVHFLQWASRRRRTDVLSAHSAMEAVDILVQAVEDKSPPPPVHEVIVGHGFRDALWSAPPHKDLLQAALPDRPVAVVSQDLHTLWLSPAALALLERDDPTGVLREQDCIDAHDTLARWQQSSEGIDRWVAQASFDIARRGVTRIIDYEHADNVTEWSRRHAAVDIGVRVDCAVWETWLDQAIERRLTTGTVLDGSRGRVRVGPCKLVADGSLNSRTAHCHDPYEHAESGQDRYGQQVMTEDELVNVMRRAAAAGLGPAVHAIGDRATTTVLDAFQRVGCTGRIEHAQMVRPDDVERFARLGLVASIQPQHAVADRDVADYHWGARTAWAFPYAALHAVGVPLVLGSDAPVSEPDPWQAIADAVARTDDERPPWHAEQALPLDVALRAASGGRATLEVGDIADIVVAAADPSCVGINDLRSMPVHATLLGGEFTFRSEDD